MTFFFSKPRTKRSKSLMYRIDGGGRENRLEKFLHDSVQLFGFLSLFRPIHKYTIGRDSNEIEKRINANSPIISTSV